MHNIHSRNTIRYYVLIVILLVFLFFSNDFGLIDVQKTAIIMAAGIDKEENTFIVTSQIAIPQSSQQGKNTQAVQIVSRGKTIADAFEEINAKTGWYPKLVFCNLILLGKDAAQDNVFDALEYFLRDEYLSDNCLVATCDGYAKDLLNVSALVDSSSSMAMTKVLSDHAKRVGTVLPSTLRTFSIGYFSDTKSGFLPILSKQPQQEQIGDGSAQNGSNPSGSSGSASGGSSGDSGNEASGSGADAPQDKPVFSAQETALFVGGRRAETLTAEETFALSAVMEKLQLAPYSVEQDGNFCTLTVKQNTPKRKLTVKNGIPILKIRVDFSAGIRDYSAAQALLKTSDVGDVPKGVFALAERKMKAEITATFEKSRACGCDVFGVRELLEKYEKKHFDKFKDTVLQEVQLDVEIRFRNVR